MPETKPLAPEVKPPASAATPGPKPIGSAIMGSSGRAGYPELGKLIRDVARSKLSIGDKIKALEDGAATIRSVTFKQIADVPGARAVFVGMQSSVTRKTPILVVLIDGRFMTGTLDDELLDGLPERIDYLKRIRLPAASTNGWPGSMRPRNETWQH